MSTVARRFRFPENVEHRLTNAERELFKGRTYRGAGCDECTNSGYRGRIGYFELLRINARLRQGISENMQVAELRRRTDADFAVMRVDGMHKAARGETTIEEVLRATQDTDDSDV